MQRFSSFVHTFFSEEGSVGSPESLKMNGFPFHDFFGGVASVGSPESWEMQ
jgi:hypothetical protein